MKKVFILIFTFIVILGVFIGIFSLNSCSTAYADEQPVFVPSKEYIVSRIYGAQGSPNYYPGGAATTENMSLMYSWLYDVDNDKVEFFFFNNDAGYMNSSGRLLCCNAGLNAFPVDYSFIRGSWQVLYFAYNYNGAFQNYDNIVVSYYCYPDFNFSAVREIFYTSGVDSNSPYNEIRYIDSNDSLFRVQFRVYVDTATDNRFDFLYSNKTLYVQTVDKNTVDWQAGRDYGYDEGFRVGDSEGRKIGHSEGFNAGMIQGKAEGYELGVSASNDYTFFGLFSAIFDAPIKIMRGLFDFEIFGVNMSSFVFSLLSISITIFIIKFILSR